MKFTKVVKSAEIEDKELFIQQLANIQKEINIFLGVADELNFRDPVISQGFKTIREELDIIKNHIKQ